MHPVRVGHRWQRQVRSRRGATGLALGGAALLLWPFAGWSWIPWLAGVVALVLLRLLRLDGLLRGWSIHVAGVVVVAGLMLSSRPWAWALAASIGVLIAGIVLLPRWRLAAVGVVLCLITGAALTWSNIRDTRDAAASYAPTQERSRHDQGAPRADSVLPILLNRIAQGSPGAVCDNLLSGPAGASFAAAVSAPDCAAAVLVLASRVTDPIHYADAAAPRTRAGDRLIVDACGLSWGPTAAGPQLGHLTIGPIAPSRYVVTEFRAC